MDKPYQGPNSHLFTLRLWREEVAAGQSEWRGKVQQVNTGEAHYFHEWDALISLLIQMLSASAPPPETHLRRRYLANTSLFPARSTPKAVKVIVASALSP